MLKLFEALPAYFGGKRKLANRILSFARGSVFIDAFAGGCSVSLLGKAKGYRVIANDIAERSEIVGRALIENEDIFVTEEDVVRLFEPNAGNKHFIRDNFPEQYREDMADFLDNARSNIDEYIDPVKKQAMMLLWIHMLMYYRPMSSFTHTGAVSKLEDESYDKDTIARLRERYSQPRYDVVKKLAAVTNEGIFPNGHDNEFHRKDIFEFLKDAQGDTIYLDPPYYGSQSYEYHYNVLDCMIAGRKIKPEHSLFNSKHVFANTSKLLDACKHIRTCILSVGQRIIDKQTYVNLMGEYWKDVEDIPVKHTHVYGVGANEESGKQEVLLVGRAA